MVTTGSTLARTSARSSILAAKCEPLGSETVSRSPSSETAVEESSSDPLAGTCFTSWSTTCFHVR